MPTSDQKNVSRALFSVSNEKTTETVAPITPIKLPTDVNKSSVVHRSLDNQEDGFPSLCSTPIRTSAGGSNNSRHSLSSIANFSRTTIGANSSSFSPQIFTGHNRSQQTPLQIRSKNASPSSSLCLSDFITPTSSARSKNRKTPKSHQQQHHSADNSSMMSEQEYPSLGARSKTAAGSSCRTSSEQLHTSLPTTPITILKPKKRVAPITVAATTSHSNRSDFGSPAFRCDNNLLNISTIDDDSRKLLKTHIEEISKDFENEPLADHRGVHAIIQEKHNKSMNKSDLNPKNDQNRIDLSKIEHKIVLEKLINIHSAIIDMNLMTNVLTEIAYLLNLLNVDPNAFSMHGTNDQPSSVTGNNIIDPLNNEINESNLITKRTSADNELLNNNVSMNKNNIIVINCETNLMLLPGNILKTVNNCVYYSLGVLNKQKHILALLDITTIKVLLDNERLSEFNENIKEFLFDAYTHKLKLESLKRNHDISFKPSSSSFPIPYGIGMSSGRTDGGICDVGGSTGGGGGNNINVFYQQENDTKDNFPSIREFMAFRKQRDCFCNILR